jgi:hypothetical protein
MRTLQTLVNGITIIEPDFKRKAFRTHSTTRSKPFRATLDDIFVTQERLAEKIHGDLSAALHVANEGSERIQ